MREFGSYGFRLATDDPTSFSSARWKEAMMGIPIERLTAARATLVRIVKSRDDGARYIPLILRLEREIEAMQTQTDHYQRILAEAA